MSRKVYVVACYTNLVDGEEFCGSYKKKKDAEKCKEYIKSLGRKVIIYEEPIQEKFSKRIANQYL